MVKKKQLLREVSLDPVVRVLGMVPTSCEAFTIPGIVHGRVVERSVDSCEPLPNSTWSV